MHCLRFIAACDQHCTLSGCSNTGYLKCDGPCDSGYGIDSTDKTCKGKKNLRKASSSVSNMADRWWVIICKSKNGTVWYSLLWTNHNALKTGRRFSVHVCLMKVWSVSRIPARRKMRGFNNENSCISMNEFNSTCNHFHCSIRQDLVMFKFGNNQLVM